MYKVRLFILSTFSKLMCTRIKSSTHTHIRATQIASRGFFLSIFFLHTTFFFIFYDIIVALRPFYPQIFHQIHDSKLFLCLQINPILESTLFSYLIKANFIKYTQETIQFISLISKWFSCVNKNKLLMLLIRISYVNPSNIVWNKNVHKFSFSCRNVFHLSMRMNEILSCARWKMREKKTKRDWRQ